MKRLFAVILALALPTVSSAAEMAIEAGFRQQSGSTDSAGVSAKSQVGYQFGLSATFPLNDALGLRSGLFYTQRPLLLQSDAGLGEAKVNLTHFDIPALLSYQFEEYASLFAGPVLAVKLDAALENKSGQFSSLKIEDDKSMLIPIQIGASFKFAPQMGATVFFETIPGSVAKDIGSYRSVGANFLFTFE